MTYAITINATPVAKGRPRFARRGNFIQTYTPTKTLEYEKMIAKEWGAKVGFKFPPETPLEVKVDFYMPVPESFSKKKKAELMNTPHIKKSDVDNLVKSVLDGLNETAFPDDSAICKLSASKQYAEQPHIYIEISEVGQNG